MDLIDRQVAIEAIARRDTTDGTVKVFGGREVVEILKSLPSAQPDPQWIPCSERLPEEGHDVLITKKPFKIKGYEQEVIKAKRSVDPRSGKIEWWSPEFGALKDKAVLAWMPLPEPYWGEQNE